jgi:hypothetical protein
MNKMTAFLVLTAAGLALAGCSSTPTKVNSGTISARSFNFVNRAGTVPAYADGRQHVHALVQQAITKNLATRGVGKVETGGDITVSYLVIVGNNATTTSLNDYFGYGGGASELQDKAHKAYTGNKNPNYFEAGTLLIDLVDSKSFKLLRRGHASRPILRDLPDDQRAARIQEVVDEILRDVRFKP